MRVALPVFERGRIAAWLRLDTRTAIERAGSDFAFDVRDVEYDAEATLGFETPSGPSLHLAAGQLGRKNVDAPGSAFVRWAGAAIESRDFRDPAAPGLAWRASAAAVLGEKALEANARVTADARWLLRVGPALVGADATVDAVSPMLLVNYARVLRETGRLDEAADAWRAAVGIRPRSAEARFALGNVLFAMRDDRGAIDSYREALRLAPEWAPALAALGVAEERGGDVEAALRSHRRAVAADPLFFEAWNRIGVLEERRGRLAEARTAYESGLGARPDDPGLLFNHAKSCLRLGDLGAGAPGRAPAPPGSPCTAPAIRSAAAG